MRKFSYTEFNKDFYKEFCNENPTTEAKILYDEIIFYALQLDFIEKKFNRSKQYDDFTETLDLIRKDKEKYKEIKEEFKAFMAVDFEICNIYNSLLDVYKKKSKELDNILRKNNLSPQQQIDRGDAVIVF